MPLIKSVSGIRGTIGGNPGENLTPPDIVAFVAAYGAYLLQSFPKPIVVVGRDGRISGEMVKELTIQTLRSLGIDVIDLDYSTTPSVEMYVQSSRATGGIIITASHNPAEWNALKFLNHQGEFISPESGEEIIQNASTGVQHITFASVDRLGQLHRDDKAIAQHIEAILQHKLIDADTVRKRKLKVVVDAINSTGSISIPPLLHALGVDVHMINGEMTGQFAHNPEPLPEHLHDLCRAVKDQGADLGISVDPDVDRLALVDEKGDLFGEEYTLVCAADYVLSHRKGPVVSNLSSSLALRDLARTHGVDCYYAPVGEVHVVKKMKAVGAVIGGEGNGGVIDPQLHYGRDALNGIALILMHLATSGKRLSELKNIYSPYVVIKDKIVFDPTGSPDAILKMVSSHYASAEQDTQDGLKIIFEDRWVHIRKSNTEPILRIYAEARDTTAARSMVDEVKQRIRL